MKSILKLLATLLLITPFAHADDNFTIRDGDGNKRTIAATDDGLEVYTIHVTNADGTTGLSQSVVPVSNNTDLNGVGAVIVGAIPVADDTIEAASTTTLINATSHVARVGDIFATISGTAANLGTWSSVCAPVTANSFTLCNALPTTPSTDNFRIFRPKVPSLTGTNSNPGLAVTIQTTTQDSAAIGLLKAEDAASASGDALVGVAAVRNEGTTTLTDTNLDYGAIAVNRYGAVNTQFSTEFTGLSSGSTSFPYRNEDAAFGDGYATMVAGAVNNRSQSTFNSTGGDVTPIGVGDYGEVTITMSPSAQTFANSAIRAEDAAFADGSGLVMAGGQSLSAIAQSVGTSGDVAPPAQDLGNRQIVTNAPSGEMVVGCNTAITTATTGSMIAAVASKFTFITSWQCTNTGGAASRVILEDGDGTDLANLLVAGTTGFAQVTFPTPVRTNVVNKAIQVNVITTGTSTICCASGYTGAI